MKIEQERGDSGSSTPENAFIAEENNGDLAGQGDL